MGHSSSAGRRDQAAGVGRSGALARRLLTDGGREPDEDGRTDSDADAQGDDETEEAGDESAAASNVEVTEAGGAEPVDPKWQKPDLDDIPEVDGPKTRPAESHRDDGAPSRDGGGTATGPEGAHAGHDARTSADTDTGFAGEPSGDPTAGMPNTARSPGQSRLKEGGADGFVAALELCARLPDEVRLPEAAADLVPVALEAELEQDVQSFAAEEFDNPAPHVETLEFVEVEDELWLRLRLGVAPGSFADLDPEEIRSHALQQIDGLL